MIRIWHRNSHWKIQNDKPCQEVLFRLVMWSEGICDIRQWTHGPRASLEDDETQVGKLNNKLIHIRANTLGKGWCNRKGPIPGIYYMFSCIPGETSHSNPLQSSLLSRTSLSLLQNHCGSQWLQRYESVVLGYKAILLPWHSDINGLPGVGVCQYYCFLKSPWWLQRLLISILPRIKTLHRVC